MWKKRQYEKKKRSCVVESISFKKISQLQGDKFDKIQNWTLYSRGIGISNSSGKEDKAEVAGSKAKSFKEE